MSPINEDELRARLRSVEPSPAPPGLADHVIGQGRARRRQRRWLTALATAAAVAVIGVGVVAVGDQLGPDDALPASPSPTPTSAQPTPTVTGTTTPTTTPTATATSAPTVTAAPSATPTATASGTGTTPTPTRITFLHEGVEGDGETTSDWRAASAIVGPCDGDAWALAGARGATERRAIRGGGGDGGPTGEGYLVFPTARDAVAFMGELRARSRGCETATGGKARGLVEELSGPWGEGIAFSWFPNETTIGGAPVGLAVRSGRAVAMSAAAGPHNETTSIPDYLVTSARPAVEHLFPQLCRYTQAGC